MEVSNIRSVFFSPTYSTRHIVRLITTQFGDNLTEYDITQAIPVNDVVSEKNDLLVVGVPVYAGRVPGRSLRALRRFKGDATPAIIVCVYGNRDYDDALLELKDIVQENGFKVVAAGAFIAQHSIFPEVGQGRPDETDMEAITAFAHHSIKILEGLSDISALPDIAVKGNYPYRIPSGIPLHPKGNKNCNECNACVKLCPTQAIPENMPRSTDEGKCISCGRCIAVCPQNARLFKGILYKMAGKRFVHAYYARKEPETAFIKG